MSLEENKAVVHRLFEAKNKRNLAVIHARMHLTGQKQKVNLSFVNT